MPKPPNRPNTAKGSPTKPVITQPSEKVTPELADEALARCTKFIQAKDFDSANALFQKLVKAHPDNPKVLLQYAVLKLQTGENSFAEDFLKKSLAKNEGNPLTAKYLGLALLRQSKFEAALETFEKVEAGLEKDPDFHYYKGQTLGSLNRLEDAVKSVARALTLRPEFPSYLHILGTLFTQLKQDKRALPIYYRALDLSPTMWAARMSLGHALMKLGRHKEAISHYAEVLRDAPDRLDVMTNLGNAYLATEDYVTAESQFKKLKDMFPAQAVVYNNLGNFYSKTNRYDEALLHYEQAIERQHVYPEAWNNYSITLRRLNRVEESLKGLETAITQKVEFPDARWNRSLCLLLLGRIDEGFSEYEWRWRGGVKELKPRKMSKPEWKTGESIQGKRIFVHSEQGLGDHIQFMRYLPILQSMGAQVMAEFPEPLLEIAKGYAPDITWVERGTRKLPEFDVYCPLLTIPARLSTTLETIPAPKAYLKATPERKKFFQEKLKDTQGPRVGLVWSGNPKHQNDRNRSLTLKSLLNALGKAEFTPVSLMKEVRPEDQEYLKENANVLDFSQDLDSFADTAGLIANLDLVITVDTSVAHLAGALGCPVWVLTPFAPDWRWMLDRRDSPWYPSMVLYRQHAPHDWDGVMKEVAEDLQKIGQETELVMA